MRQPIENNQIRRYLAAFADGELDVEQSLRVLQRMAMDPQMTKRVMHQQQLRQRVAQAMAEPAIKAPPELRRRVVELAQEELVQVELTQQTPQPGRRVGGPAVVGKGTGARSMAGEIRRWLPAAVAALLLMANLAVFYWDRSSGSRSAAQPVPILNANELEQFSRRHVLCSRGIAQPDPAAQLPQQVTALPAALQRYFGRAVDLPPLDLSSLGYQLAKAGTCAIPGPGSVHLIYQASAASGRSDALSLWILPDDGRTTPPMQAGALYTLAGPSKAHPMLGWKHDGMAYFLMGDSMGPIDQVIAQLYEPPEGAGMAGFGCH
ncbi:MAG TPA: hypothetical protein VF184_08850 [Phycisphaeraceae bacterium]